MKTKLKFRSASRQPKKDIELISYEGQLPEMKMYKEGFEPFMDFMPVLDNDSKEEDIEYTKSLMNFLSKKILREDDLMEMPIEDNTFKRTIVALEPPVPFFEKHPLTVLHGIKPGAEFVVAHWGKGFSSPIHGHATGFMYEEVLTGRIKVFSYLISDEDNNIVRYSSVEIVEKGVFVSEYAPETGHSNKRRTLVHNFQALERSNTLHFLPEHTRDGRDNGFKLEEWNYLDTKDVVQHNAQQGLLSKKGDVFLVRSSNVPEFGDHYIIITGPPILKEHGLRPQEYSIPASKEDKKVLDAFLPISGLVLLKLSESATQNFHSFHNTKFTS